MAVNIKLKHSSVDGKAPVASDLENGELALNVNANSPAAYIKDSAGNVVKLAGEGSVTDEASVKKVGDTMTGPLVLSGDPTADDQASNKKYVDDSFLDAGGDGKYAEVAGDNFTGNVTFGSDKIVLDATNGTAVFTLQTITGTPSQGTFVNAYGANRIAVNSGAAGTVFNVNDTGVVVTNDRLVCNAGGNKEDSADAFLVYKEDGTTTGASVTAGGAASFAGSGSFGGQVSVNRGLASNNNAATLLIGNTSTNSAISLNNDGSSDFGGKGTFESIIQVGGNPYPGTATGFAAYNDGSIVISSTSPAGQIFRGYTTGTNVETSTIFADGSCTFAGSASFAGDLDAGSGIFNNGKAKVFVSSGDAGLYVYDVADTSTPTAIINKDGSGTFSGLIKTGSSNTNQGTGSWIQDLGGVYTTRPAGSAESTFAGYQQGSASPTFQVTANGTVNCDGNVTANGIVLTRNVEFQLEADDDTKYDVTTEEYTETETYTVEVPVLRPEGVVGTADLVDEPKTRTVTKEREVTKTREVRTYNGAVLDVKDELQSLRSRATQQDETIKLMKTALKGLGVDVSAFPSPEDEEPKTRSRKKK